MDGCTKVTFLILYGTHWLVKKELQFCHNASLLYSNSYVSCFLGKHNCLMPENPYDSLLFVTGTINYYVECGVTAFSIVPTNIKKNVRAKNKEQWNEKSW